MNAYSYGTFEELVSFPAGANTADFVIEAFDDRDQVTRSTLTVSRDNQPPTLVIDGDYLLAPAVNSVNQTPLTLSGTVTEAQLSRLTLNDTSLTVNPVGEGVYTFTVEVPLAASMDNIFSLIAADFAGNETQKELVFSLASETKIEMLLPVDNAKLLTQGAPVDIQVAARLTGETAGLTAKATAFDSQNTPVGTVTLQLDNQLVSGDLQLPATAGNYTVNITVRNADQQSIASTSRQVILEAPQAVELAIEKMEPAEGQQHVEPNNFISVMFNQPVDPALVDIQVAETAHGETWVRSEERGQSGFAAPGYTIINVDRDFASVPGKHSSLPGDKLIAFYPARELAYNANVFVTVSYNGDELLRTQFKTRALPTFVNGGIHDALLQPVGGIEVSIPELNRTTVTTHDGGYSFGYGEIPGREIPAGEYTLVVNSGLKTPNFGTYRGKISLQAGRRNRINSITLPIINKNDSFSPMRKGEDIRLGKGDVVLDFKNATPIFPDGKLNGLALAQFTMMNHINKPLDPVFISPWFYTIQPSGIKVTGDPKITLTYPQYENQTLGKPADGQRVILLGLDPESDSIVPIGVGEVAGNKIESLKLEIKVLDLIGQFPVREEDQPLLQRYLDGEISLKQMVLPIRNGIRNAMEEGSVTNAVE